MAMVIITSLIIILNKPRSLDAIADWPVSSVVHVYNIQLSNYSYTHLVQTVDPVQVKNKFEEEFEKVDWLLSAESWQQQWRDGTHVVPQSFAAHYICY